MGGDIDHYNKTFKSEGISRKQFCEIRLELSKKNVTEKLPILFKAAHKVCTAEDAGTETLVLASMMSVVKNLILRKKRVNKDEMLSITQPYRSLFKVGDSMQVFSNAS